MKGLAASPGAPPVESPASPVPSRIPSPAEQRRPLLVANLLILTSFGEQLWWLPLLVVLAAERGDVGVVAWAASAYSLANLLGNVAAGLSADRAGRRRVAAAGLWAMAATALLHLVARTPWQLVAARSAHGLAAGAVVPAAFALLGDRTRASRRSQVMAGSGAVIAVASLISPPLSGAVTRALGPAVAVGMAAAAVAAVGSLVLLLLREPARGSWIPMPGTQSSETAPERAGGLPGVPAGRPAHPAADSATAAPAVAAVPGSPEATAPFDPRTLAVGLAAGFALMFGQNVLFYHLPVQARELGLDPAVTGQVLAGFAVGALAVFLTPVRRLGDTRGRLVPISIGLGLVATAQLGLTQTSAPVAMALWLALYGAGFGLAFPPLGALTADSGGARRKGTAFGLLTAAFSLGSVLGPATTRALSALLPPFAVAAVLAAGGAVVAGVALAAQGQASRSGRSPSQATGEGRL